MSATFICAKTNAQVAPTFPAPITAIFLRPDAIQNTPIFNSMYNPSIRILGVILVNQFSIIDRVVQEPSTGGTIHRVHPLHSRGGKMKIGVPMEPEGETRVAIVPGSMKNCKSGFEVVVEKGAGVAANYSDSEYTEAGASIGDRKDVMSCEIVISIRMPDASELSKGQIIACVVIHSVTQRRFKHALTEVLH